MSDAVRIEHLSFRYAGSDTPALRDLSMRVGQGEMVVIMGATGAGKSTLARILNRSIPSFERGELQGSVQICGRTLHNETVGDLAETVGLVTQDFEAQLFSTNVLQEVAFGLEAFGIPPHEIRRRARTTLEAVGLHGFEDRDPATLSGGEKQRLAIAATLALEPRVVVLDEPTTDLDPLGKIEIFELLARMRAGGYTLIVIEHETAAAEHADRLLLMSGGRIVADDHPQRLFAQPRRLAALGVRPTDLGLLADAVGLDRPPASVEEAAAELKPRRLDFCAAAEPVSPPPSVPPLVEADGLEYCYDGGRIALRGVSLRIGSGELVALIGQNGSGKTTLAKHLNGLLRPTKGRVRLRGQDIASLPLDRVAGNVGYVFQNPDHQIFAATVAEEVAFGPRNFGLEEAAVRERVAWALEAVGLEGMEGEDPFLLSKGHRQRLAVSSLLALRPELLILDEPTTGLDYAEQRQMMDLLARLNEGGMALLIITHSPWVVAEYARRGVLMQGGEILFDGSLRDLFARDQLLARARFCAPDITRVGRLLGMTPLSVGELAAALQAARKSPR